jgi:hypothetical protein
MEWCRPRKEGYYAAQGAGIIRVSPSVHLQGMDMNVRFTQERN